jgi:hypothetical protein
MLYLLGLVVCGLELARYLTNGHKHLDREIPKYIFEMRLSPYPVRCLSAIAGQEPLRCSVAEPNQAARCVQSESFVR